MIISFRDYGEIFESVRKSEFRLSTGETIVSIIKGDVTADERSKFDRQTLRSFGVDDEEFEIYLKNKNSRLSKEILSYDSKTLRDCTKEDLLNILEDCYARERIRRIFA